MRFGLSLPMQHPIGDDLGRRFAELLEMVRLARQAGFHHISARQHYLAAAPFQYMRLSRCWRAWRPKPAR